MLFPPAALTNFHKFSDLKQHKFGKDLDAVKDWRQKEKTEAEDEIDSITDSMNMSLSKLREIAKDRKAWRAAVRGGHEESDKT